MRVLNIVIVTILIIFILFIPIKVILELLIHDNYTKRINHSLPDKLYWADSLYMKTFCSADLNLCKEFYQKEIKRIENAKI